MEKELTKNQKIVLEYLKDKDFTSPTEIGHQLGGHSAIGSPVCKSLVKLGFVERSGKGHYRLTPTATVKKNIE